MGACAVLLEPHRRRWRGGARAVAGMGTRLQVEVSSGDAAGGASAGTPASTRMARGLSAELDEVLGRAPPRSPAPGFLATAMAPAPAGTSIL